MKFLCGNCKAKYQIADEKVVGRTLRMTCRRCKEEIVIHGGSEGVLRSSYPVPSPAGARLPPPPPPPSPLGADFQMQVAGHARALAPVAPILDEWHVGINEVPVGPMRRDELARKLAAGAINADSLAWREGLDDWLPIRHIPELAVLFAPPGSIGLPPPAAYVPVPPQVLLQPAQRSELAPIGGRSGAGPAYVLDDWAPIVDQVSHSQVSQNPLLAAGPAERRSPVLPSWPVMFALAGGFAFLMSALAIIGASWLQSGQRAAVPVVSAPPVAGAEAARARLDPQTQPSGSPEGNVVIALDDPGMQNQARSGGTARGAASAARAGQLKPKKELTDAQKAMLARMGGGDGTAVANLKPTTTTSGGTGPHGAGGLTAPQLSKVVLKGREMLQRCYETALRGSGSTETVRMDVEVTVSPSGNVTSAKAGGQGLPGMGQCIERTVKMWRFPEAGEATQTKFPVVFQPGS
jgi:hypothetical protein